MKTVLGILICCLTYHVASSQTLQSVIDNGNISTTPVRFHGRADFGEAWDPVQYGAVQIVQPAEQGTKFHLSFIRNGQMIYGLGFLNNSNVFGIQPGGSNASLDGIFMSTNGNVGIGLTNPASKLDIRGQFNSFSVGIGQQDLTTSSINFANFGSNNHGSVLISSNLYVNGDDNLKIAKSHPTMAGASILIPGNTQPNQGGIVFYTNQPASVIEDANFNGTMSMIIKNDGNIGIGTITPREKLSVNGKIRAHEIKVETANWPDFVFAKDYSLPSLTETEKHIKEKGHLPGIPSAAEVKTNGIDLGEMNAKLLQKIEELTLYLIELKNHNDVLQKTVKEQNEKFRSDIDLLKSKVK